MVGDLRSKVQGLEFTVPASDVEQVRLELHVIRNEHQRIPGCGCRVSGFGLGVQGSGFRFRVSGFGFRISGSGLRGCGVWVAGCGLRIAVCGLRVAGCGLRVAGCGLRVAVVGCQVYPRPHLPGPSGGSSQSAQFPLRSRTFRNSTSPVRGSARCRQGAGAAFRGQATQHRVWFSWGPRAV